ncbi:MAG: hypothetical protein AAGE52_06950 [Myxococcota bacterium]
MLRLVGGGVLFALVVLAPLSATNTLVAAQSPLAAHSGDYVWTGESSEQAAIATAIEAAVEGMNSLSANIARARLAIANEPAERLSVQIDESGTTLRAGDRETHVPATGTSRVRGLGGERVRASQRVEGSSVHLTFRGGQGTRHQTLEFHGGTLVVDVRIESRHLTSDVHYRLTYRRAS